MADGSRNFKGLRRLPDTPFLRYRLRQKDEIANIFLFWQVKGYTESSINRSSLIKSESINTLLNINLAIFRIIDNIFPSLNKLDKKFIGIIKH